MGKKKVSRQDRLWKRYYPNSRPRSSVERALPSEGKGREFESPRGLQFLRDMPGGVLKSNQVTCVSRGKLVRIKD